MSNLFGRIHLNRQRKTWRRFALEKRPEFRSSRKTTNGWPVSSRLKISICPVLRCTKLRWNRRLEKPQIFDTRRVGKSVGWVRFQFTLKTRFARARGTAKSVYEKKKNQYRRKPKYVFAAIRISNSYRCIVLVRMIFFLLSLLLFRGLKRRRETENKRINYCDSVHIKISNRIAMTRTFE